MTSLESMLSKLSPLGLYDLGEGTAVRHELAAYSEGLDILFDCLEELEREYFPQTASHFGLDEREKLCGRVHSELSVEQRRRRLIEQEQNGQNYLTADAFRSLILAMGAERVYVFENTAGTNKLLVRIVDELSDSEKSELKEKVKNAAPAFLECEIRGLE